MENELIVVRQLPVIEDQLAAVKESITRRVNDALSLVCTEETCKQVKKVRAELNKEYMELETKRKAVKKAVLAPYEKFEAVYKDCAGDLYTKADIQLKQKIAEVEDGLKKQKINDLRAYFVEYRESLGLSEEMVKYDDTGIRVNLSDSMQSLKKRARDFLDHIADDLKAIESREDRDEIVTEYKRGFNLAAALNAVEARHRAIEEAKRAREEAEARRKAQEDQQAQLAAVIAAQAAQEAPETAPAALEAPAAAPAAEDSAESVPAPTVTPAAPEAPAAQKLYSATFKVYGTIEKLKALKAFLEEGGYRYEQC